MNIVLSQAALILCAISVFSQAPDAPATFSSKVNLVMVPVVVRDRDGRSIGSLKKEDFQLFDKGKPQVISEFVIEKGEKTEGIAETAPGMKKATASAPPASRFVAYLFDDLHIGFADLVRTRAAAVQHLEESLKPGDRVAIYTTSGQNTLDFTDDREKLLAVMNHLTPRARATHTAGDCPDVSEYVADAIINLPDATAMQMAVADAAACLKSGSTRMQLEAEVRAAARRVLTMSDADAQVSIGALRNAVQRISTVPGQRTIVLVSPGFLVTAAYRLEEAEAIDRAIRAHVTVSTLDARGLYTVTPGGDPSKSSGGSSATARIRFQTEAAQAQGDLLGELADGTGGTLFHNNDNLLEGFRRTSAFPEFVYMLGFAPQDMKLDGSFHALKVTAKTQRDVTLQTRRGYFAPKHADDPTEAAKEKLGVVLFSRDEMSDIPVSLETQFVKASDKSAKLTVVAHIDMKPVHFEKADGMNRARLSLASAVFDRNGVLVSTLQKDFNLSLTDARLEAARVAGVALPLSFDISPGSYLVRLVVRDGDGQTASRNGVVEIP